MAVIRTNFKAKQFGKPHSSFVAKPRSSFAPKGQGKFCAKSQSAFVAKPRPTAFVAKPRASFVAKGQGKVVGAGKGAGKSGSWVFVPAGTPVQSVIGGNRPVVKGFGKGGKSLKGGKGGKGAGSVGKGGKQQDARHIKSMDKLGKIEAERKVWVGGLAKATDWKKLKTHFTESSCQPVITELLGTKGTACLAFKTADDASAAIATLNGSELGDQTIEVDVWTQKEKKEKKDKTERDGPKQIKKHTLKNKAIVLTGKQAKMTSKIAEKLKTVDNKLKVWVGGMAKETTWKELKQHFVDSGCEIHMCDISNSGKGCVAFKTADEAISAIGLVDATELNGKSIKVAAWGHPKDKKLKEEA